MSISVEIRSRSLPERSCPRDFYIPRLESYPANAFTSRGHHVKHRHVVYIWKGMDLSQAQELSFWEQATKVALESYVEERLIALFVDQVKDVDDLPAAETLSLMCAFVNNLGYRQLTTPVRNIVDFMIDYHSAYGTQYEWLINHADAEAAITNYLRTFDIFRQNDLGKCIFQIHLQGYITSNPSELDDALQPSQNLHIVGTISSPPHQLDFAVHPRTVLKPMFREPFLDLGVPLFPLTVKLSEIGLDAKTADIIVTKVFPGGVRLERLMRLVFQYPIDRRTLDPNSCPISTELDFYSTSSDEGDDSTEIRPIKTPLEEVIQFKSRRTPRMVKTDYSPRIGLDPPAFPLRAISSGSTRVQGRVLSDFECSAKQNHPKVFSSYDTIPEPSVSKLENTPSRVFEQIYNPRTTDVSVNIMTHLPSTITRSGYKISPNFASPNRQDATQSVRRLLELEASEIKPLREPGAGICSTNPHKTESPRPLHRRSYDDQSESEATEADVERSYKICSAFVIEDDTHLAQSQLTSTTHYVSDDEFLDGTVLKEWMVNPFDRLPSEDDSKLSHLPLSYSTSDIERPHRPHFVPSQDNPQEYNEQEPLACTKSQDCKDHLKFSTHQPKSATRSDSAHQRYQVQWRSSYQVMAEESMKQGAYFDDCVGSSWEHAQKPWFESSNCSSGAGSAIFARNSNSVANVTAMTYNSRNKELAPLDQERIKANYEEFLGPKERTLSQLELEEAKDLEQAFLYDSGSSDPVVCSSYDGTLDLSSLPRSGVKSSNNVKGPPEPTQHPTTMMQSQGPSSTLYDVPANSRYENDIHMTDALRKLVDKATIPDLYSPPSYEISETLQTKSSSYASDISREQFQVVDNLVDDHLVSRFPQPPHKSTPKSTPKAKGKARAQDSSPRSRESPLKKARFSHARESNTSPAVDKLVSPPRGNYDMARFSPPPFSERAYPGAGAQKLDSKRHCDWEFYECAAVRRREAAEIVEQQKTFWKL